MANCTPQSKQCLFLNQATWPVVLALAYMPLLLACSKDQPTPTSPASKIAVTADAPGVPINLRVEALTDTSAKVAWDAVEGATDYDLNYRTLDGRWTNEPHRGTRLWNIIYDLAPGTEYRWAVRAENSDGTSEWVFAENFTTTAPYLRFTFDKSINDREVELILEAADKWENVIAGGHPEGLNIEIADNMHMQQLGTLGYAYIKNTDTFNGRRFNTDCFIGLNSETYTFNENHNFWNNTAEEFMVYVAFHEIGHCLGIGMSDEWDNMVQYIDGWYEHPTEYAKVERDGWQWVDGVKKTGIQVLA